MTNRASAAGMDTARAARPNPATEIRMTTLHAVRGPNFWSRRPVVCMDVTIGAYEDLSSADVAGVTESLVAAMPGLVEHHCSIGSRGGFITRLERGTYAPHITEHVALELQILAGHDVGYGRTRGGDAKGSYTIAFEYRHEQVGLRSAALALGIVQRAFAGMPHETLELVHSALEELIALGRTRNIPAPQHEVFCGIVGSGARAETRRELGARMRRAGWTDAPIVEFSPAYLLLAGLPYSRSAMAIVLDTTPDDVPRRYQDQAQAERLMGVLVDAIPRGGILICPATAHALRDYAREREVSVAVFLTGDDVASEPPAALSSDGATAFAFVRENRITIQHDGTLHDVGLRAHDVPVNAQLAAALGERLCRDLRCDGTSSGECFDTNG
jgi:hypothetical protein